MQRGNKVKRHRPKRQIIAVLLLMVGIARTYMIQQRAVQVNHTGVYIDDKDDWR